MKAVICLLVPFFSAISYGQTQSSGTTAPTPPGAFAPARGGSTATTPPANASVGSPALATSSSLNAAALTNNLAGLGFTNQFGTNFTSSDLATVLVGLQNSLQQALTLLGGFNGSLLLGGGTTSVAGNNFGQNLGTGGGVNLGANLAQNVATPTTSVSPAATPPSVFSQPTQTPVPPGALAAPVATATNVTGVPATAATANPVGGGTVPLNDSVRLLIILQHDIEQLLPEVAAATGSPFIIGSGAFATNNFGTGANGVLGSAAGVLSTGTTRIPARTTATTTPRQTLTPTGR